VIGTVFTLFIVPSIYMLVARTRARVVEDHVEDDLPAAGLVGA
jgi:hypothetical protein